MFIIGYVHMSMCLTLICLIGFRVAWMLLATIKPHLEETVADKKIQEFSQGLESFLKRVKIGAILLCAMFILIIWVPLTQSPTNPGLDNFFYFQFFVFVPLIALLIIMVNLVAWRDLSLMSRRGSSNGSGSHHESSERKKSKDFSFTTDELNGHPSIDMQQREID